MKGIKFYSSIIFLLALFVYLLQIISPFVSIFGFSGLFIPDSVSLLNSTSSFWDNDVTPVWWQIAPHLFVLYLYRLAPYLGSLSTFILNLFLLFCSWSLWIQTFSICSIRYSFSSTQKGLFFLFIVFASPYLLITLALPGKDIPILFFISLIARTFCAPNLNPQLRYILLLAYAVPVYFIRDAFSIILLVSVSTYPIVRRVMSFLPSLAFLCFFSVFIFFLNYSDFSYFAGLSYAFERQEYIMQSMPEIHASYFVRLFGNLCNLAFRPSIFTVEGNISILYIGLYINGILVVLGYTESLILSLRFNKLPEFVRFAIYLSFVTLAAVSFAPYVQPRYLFPILPFLALIYSFSGKKNIALLMIMLSFSSMLAFHFLFPSFLPPGSYDVYIPIL